MEAICSSQNKRDQSSVSRAAFIYQARWLNAVYVMPFKYSDTWQFSPIHSSAQHYSDFSNWKVKENESVYIISVCMFLLSHFSIILYEERILKTLQCVCSPVQKSEHLSSWIVKFLSSLSKLKNPTLSRQYLWNLSVFATSTHCINKWNGGKDPDPEWRVSRLVLE